MKKILFWAASWISSILLFIYAFHAKGVIQNFSQIELLFIALVLIYGILSFIVLNLKFEIEIKKRYSPIIASLLSILVFFLMISLGVGSIIAAFNTFTSVESKKVLPEKIKPYQLLLSPLKQGASGDDVRVLQAAFTTKSLLNSNLVTGYFGNVTVNAVKSFQKDNGIITTGEVNSQTISKFNDVFGDKTRDYYLNLVKPVVYTAPVNTTDSAIDSDPMVNCNVSVNCGSKMMKQSECKVAGCCQLSSGWYIYTSKEKCDQDQKDGSGNSTQSTPQNNGNKTAVYLQSGSKTVYCDPSYVDAVKSADQANMADYNGYTACLNNVTTNIKSCLKDCTNQSCIDMCGYANSVNSCLKTNANSDSLNSLVSAHCN